MKRTCSAWVILVGLLIVSCAKEAEDPVFFTVGPNSTITDAMQGSNFQKFLYSYVYYQNSAIGVFSEGNSFPVIPDQDNKLLVFPGIQKNGISSDPTIYPFVRPDTIEAAFDFNEVYEIVPVYRYYNSVEFDLNETFESATNFNFDLDGDNGSQLDLVSNVGYDNTGGGQLLVSAEHPNNYVGLDITFNTSDLPLNQDVYWELSYQSNVEIVLGIIGNKTSGEVNSALDLIVLRPRLEWNKVYLELSGELRDYVNFTPYLKVEYDENITEKQLVYIDDVKIVHF